MGVSIYVVVYGGETEGGGMGVYCRVVAFTLKLHPVPMCSFKALCASSIFPVNTNRAVGS